MNIRQAKARFTELTGLPAKRKAIVPGILKLRGHHSWFVSFGEGYNKNNPKWCDYRTTDFWVTLVSFLETLGEVV